MIVSLLIFFTAGLLYLLDWLGVDLGKLMAWLAALMGGLVWVAAIVAAHRDYRLLNRVQSLQIRPPQPLHPRIRPRFHGQVSLIQALLQYVIEVLGDSWIRMLHTLRRALIITYNLALIPVIYLIFSLRILPRFFVGAVRLYWQAADRVLRYYLLQIIVYLSASFALATVVFWSTEYILIGRLSYVPLILLGNLLVLISLCVSLGALFNLTLAEALVDRLQRLGVLISYGAIGLWAAAVLMTIILPLAGLLRGLRPGFFTVCLTIILAAGWLLERKRRHKPSR